MKQLKDAKKIYDHIVIPEDLNLKVRQTVDAHPKSADSHRKSSYLSRGFSAAAAVVLICLIVALNTSQVFAEDAAALPILGPVAKVLTVRSYQATMDTTTTTVEVPQVQVDGATEEAANAITDINAEIQHIVDDYTSQAHAEIAEYKEAFLSTGGTEEEWSARDIDVNVSYEVKYQSDTTLSLLLDAYESWVNFNETRYFYNIDLVTGKNLTLTDFYGDDAYEYATECVRTQMEDAIARDPDLTYWGINDIEVGETFIGVSEETPFYLNSEGQVVISYDKYEVAPGFMGIQEFVLPEK